MAAAGALGGGTASAHTSRAGSSTSEILTAYNGASGNFVDDFNPFIPGGTGIFTETHGFIYEPLLFLNWSTGKFEPWLATSYSWSDHGKRVTFTIRTGVKWSDGQPFSATDVAYTYGLIEHNSKLNTDALPITGVHQSGNKVTLDFSAAEYQNLYYVAEETDIVPKHIWDKISDPATYTDPKPVGTGPFELRSFSPQSLLLDKNPTYWQPGKPELAGIRFLGLSGNTAALSLLLAHQLDWAGLYIPDIAKTYVARDPSVNKYTTSPDAVANLTPNLDTYPTNNLAVREAISDALDRTYIASAAYGALGIAANPAWVVTPTFDSYLAPSLAHAKFTESDSKAEKTLEAAGFTKGSDGIFQSSSGQPLDITCYVVTGYSDQIQILQIVKQELAAVGIDLTPEQISLSEFGADRSNGDFQLLIDNYGYSPSPYFMFDSMLNSADSAPIGKPAPSDFSRFDNGTVDSLLAAASSSSNQAAVVKDLQRIEVIFSKDLPYIPLVEPPVGSEYLADTATGWPSASDQYAQNDLASAQDAAVVAINLVPSS